MKKLTLLGSTGSIGENSLEVIKLHPDKFEIFALTANQEYHKLFAQCVSYNPEYAVILNQEAAKKLSDLIKNHKELRTKVLTGISALNQVASEACVDIVIAGIVGSAGLEPTLSAIKASKTILLANKESLVSAGKLFMESVRWHKAVLLPIDSEHNAIFQALNNKLDTPYEKLVLTASGGPFRNYPIEQFSKITPEQACKHPNWVMGRKISVDSATMANKGLEIIEAKWLFNAKPDQIQVVIHPQSIIHSMVSYADGSVLAQLSYPDMRVPIAHALGLPERINSGTKPLDFFSLSSLTFEAPDFTRFPCLKLAYQALEADNYSTVIFNAINEVAVDAFLNHRIKFTDISNIINHGLSEIPIPKNITHLEDILILDRLARDFSYKFINSKII